MKIEKLFSILAAGLICAMILLNLSLGAVLLLFLLIGASISFRFPEKAICAYIILLPFCPFYLGVDLGLLGEINGVTMLNMVFLLPLFFKHSIGKVSKPKTNRELIKFDILIILFLVLSSFYQLANSGFMVWKGRIWHNMIDYLLIYFVITRYVITENMYGRVLESIIRGGCVFCLIGILDYVLGIRIYTKAAASIPVKLLLSKDFGLIENMRAGINRMQISFGQPISLGVYLAMLLILTLVCFDKKFNLRKKLLYSFTAILSSIGLVLTQARGPIVVAGFLLFLCFVFFKRIRLLVLNIGLVLSFTVFFVVLILPSNANRLVKNVLYDNTRNLENVNFRVELYEDVISKINRVSLIGENRNLYNSLRTKFQVDTVVWYLAILVYNGMVTLMLFLFLIGWILKEVFLNFFKNGVIIVWPLVTLLMCFLTVSFVGQSVYYFWIVIGLSIASLLIFKPVKNTNNSVVKFGV
jgi:hypothetical protein